MGNKKMPLLIMLTFCGALFAFLAGSGFASGQEVMQFTSSRGSIWSIVFMHVFSLVLMYTSYSAYAYAGRNCNAQTARDIFSFYAGDKLGRVFEICAWLYGAGCYVFMIAGFGGTLNQQFGISIPIGCAIAAGLSVITVLLGLKRLTEIIGKIGPVILIITLIVGFGGAILFVPHIDEGIAAITSGEIDPYVAGGSNLYLAAISFAGCGSLLVSAFVGRMGAELREYNFKYNKLVFGITIGFYIFCSAVMALAHLGNITASYKAAVPNLLLSMAVFGEDTGPMFAVIFSIIILLAIYSTICPLLWGTVSAVIPDEKSKKYQIAVVIVAVSVYIICLFVPYQLLLNFIMTYIGYAGGVIAITCAVRYYLLKRKTVKSPNSSPIRE